MARARGAVGTSGNADGAGGASAALTASSSVTKAAATQTPGATGSGGTGSVTMQATSGCGRRAGTSPKVRVTTVKLAAAVRGYGREGDTDPLPLAIAARPTGSSWLAWLGTDGRVHLGKLNCRDQLVGKPTSFAGIDLQDLQADSRGGVILLTRRGSCGSGPLCGGTSSPCNTMHMIRFNTSGRQVWQRQVTNLTSSRKGYTDGARFVWWYQHHGRLAFDGTNYAAYFGVAITVRNGKCVDIHQGDRMQVVKASNGALLSGHRDSFAVGCSHSWGTRIVWDRRTGHFVTVCATDNACRIARSPSYRTIASGTCDGTLFGGDLVLAPRKGYWTAWSQDGGARLERFTTGASTRTVRTPARTGHPHLVTYGNGRMLMAWESGSATAAQVYDSGTGKTVGKRFTIAVRDHAFQAFKAYSDGSAAYPAAGSTTTSIRIARVMPLAR